MIQRVATAISVLFLTSFAVDAASLGVSLRPLPRPASVSQTTFATPSSIGLLRVDPSVPGVVTSLRPLSRPGSQRIVRPATAIEQIAVQPDVSSQSYGVSKLWISLRPIPRPERIRSRQKRQSATVTPSTLPQPQPEPNRQGSAVGLICGGRSIRGEVVAPIAGTLRGCGVANPVRVHEVDGVRLSRPSIMTCETAQALRVWVSDGVRPAIRRLGGGITQLQVAAHYSCRTRNNQAGAKISEHGKGNAIDISGFKLANGRVISVENGWNDRVEGNILRRLHSAACGPFGTVLGPAANRYHRDHFHFDTARHRGGRYCR